jgi:hypothetical protein
MKKLILLVLLSTSVYSQKAKATFSVFYATGEMVGLELMFATAEGSHKFIGAGFTGATHQREALGKYVSGDIMDGEQQYAVNNVYEEFCSYYAIGSFGYIGQVLTKCKLGVGVYDHIRNFEGPNGRYHKKDCRAYIPVVGVSALLPISESTGIEIGGDCFNGASVGFTFIF